ncbi:MAG TPA: hypothetical protein VFB76_15610 [Candidatus Angelobacter sp.]|nr:hypothetical protein [Candidatus Angelobacter sp.]
MAKSPNAKIEIEKPRRQVISTGEFAELSGSWLLYPESPMFYPYKPAILSQAHHALIHGHALYAKGEGSALLLFGTADAPSKSLIALRCVAEPDPSASRNPYRNTLQFAWLASGLRVAGEMDR